MTGRGICGLTLLLAVVMGTAWSFNGESGEERTKSSKENRLPVSECAAAPEEMTEFEQLLWEFDWYRPISYWEDKADFGGGTTDIHRIFLMDFDRDGDIDILLGLSGYHAENAVQVFLQEETGFAEGGLFYGFPWIDGMMEDGVGVAVCYEDAEGEAVYLWEGEFYIASHDYEARYMVWPESGREELYAMAVTAWEWDKEAGSPSSFAILDEPVKADRDSIGWLGGILGRFEVRPGDRLDGGEGRVVTEEAYDSEAEKAISGLRETGEEPVWYLLEFYNDSFLLPGDSERYPQYEAQFGNYLYSGVGGSRAGTNSAIVEFYQHRLAAHIIRTIREMDLI